VSQHHFSVAGVACTGNGYSKAHWAFSPNCQLAIGFRSHQEVPTKKPTTRVGSLVGDLKGNRPTFRRPETSFNRTSSMKKVSLRQLTGLSHPIALAIGVGSPLK